MKHRLLLLLCLLFAVTACHEDPNPVYTNLTVSTQKLSGFSEGGTLTFDITCNSTWQISGQTDWCVPDKTSGKGNATITLTLSAYDNTMDSRQTTLTVRSGELTATVTVLQNASLSDYHYELPVIFHILQGPSSNEPIQSGWLSQVINDCNTNFQGLAGNTPDMNLSFILAEHDPNGNPLNEPGIHYVSWSTSTIDPDVFMDAESPNTQAVSLLWDLNEYINVFIYYFNAQNSNVTGISFLPYTVSANALQGLKIGDIYIDRMPKYVHCVSINRSYLYNRSTAEMHDPADIVNTLSHELGHYVGLLHAFSEDQCGDNNDYCTDTPDYNRSEYETWLDQVWDTPNLTMQILTKRSACDGTSFVSHNIMDYNYSFGDEFTEDQAKRVRHVLSYSPLIPGPKYERPISKSKQDLEIPPAIKMP